MIKANELRLGNWIDVIAGNIQQVHQIRKQAVRDGDFYLINSRLPEHVLPILLTPELLELCGFEISTDPYGGWLSPEFHDEQLRVRKDEFSYYWSNGGSSNPARFDGLHSLQNWFFVLTGQELEVKFPQPA